MANLRHHLSNYFRLSVATVSFILMGIILFAILVSNVTPNVVDVNIYERAPRDIQSPITIPLEDQTEARKRLAEESVKNEYTFDKDLALNQAVELESLIDIIITINESEKKKKDDEAPLSFDQKVDQLKDSIDTSEISDETFAALFQASETDLNNVKNLGAGVVNKVLTNPIMVEEVDGARNEAVQLIRENSNLSYSLKSATEEITRSFIIANRTLDTEKTRQKRKEASDKVEEVVIREGEVLVKSGAVITPEIYDRLKKVGLLDQEMKMYPYYGLFIFVIIVIAGLYYFMKEEREKEHFRKYVTIYALLFTLTLVVMKVLSISTELGLSSLMYAVPVAAGAMMIKMLFNEELAVVSTIIFAFSAALIFNEQTTGNFNFIMSLYVLFNGIAGIVFLGKTQQRSKILQAGFFVSFIAILTVACVLLLQNGKFTSVQIGLDLGCAGISGFVSAVLTLGLLPVIESSFNILSVTKLIELSNPNHPILRKVLMEAPGTYHHSIMVANLSEAACESIGANGLLARVGSYYHDVGKTKRPHFFIENQMNMENPHDKIAPQLSKTIITAHPYDGADMLRAEKIPKEIIDIAEQHHGTTLLKFFYHKAAQLTDKEVAESDFRYPGPKAQTKEVAIIGIADAVEAAVRSLSKPTPVKIDGIIRKIINDRLEDGQFDECDITLKELDTVAKTLTETLKGIFHSRIEYPEESKKVER
ncbi:HD family phosphohydrolase [Fictibacillus barbaricus]|uniref:HD family phosphohydrolase n=1 Tax=Fictibacillus barbaricus TaxID=182136 RepID=A0ABS2ZLM3_9BACL|nr:HD family phosphohydrolase [Fictibacillus barbaricus]MBN3547595.1 HD family phosphohydrolase [Fictibacillus barbaricus]GGB50137.1 cyclic-di-AMP phosphodiesterase PgpH [Fictibacillus barbaricus]